MSGSKLTSHLERKDGLGRGDAGRIGISKRIVNV